MTSKLSWVSSSLIWVLHSKKLSKLLPLLVTRQYINTSAGKSFAFAWHSLQRYIFYRRWYTGSSTSKNSSMENFIWHPPPHTHTLAGFQQKTFSLFIASSFPQVSTRVKENLYQRTFSHSHIFALSHSLSLSLARARA